jgi:uncharacterized protein (TIGR02145 family)
MNPRKKVYLIVALSLLLNCSFLFAQTYGKFTDSRDGKNYSTIQIGQQLWFAENLAYRTGFGRAYPYLKKSENIPKYGFLYDWSTAGQACPEGWKLPSNEDWLELSKFLGPSYKTRLMKKGVWNEEEQAGNESGFSAVPAGMRDNRGLFRAIDTAAYFWTSTKTGDQAYAYGREFGKQGGSYASHEFGSHVDMSFSVRCLRAEGKTQVPPNRGGEEQYDGGFSTEDAIVNQEKSYGNEDDVKTGITEYQVYKVMSCKEKQDDYWNYLGTFNCKPSKVNSYKFKINIHKRIPESDEALLTITNNKTREVTKLQINEVYINDEGMTEFSFVYLFNPVRIVNDKNRKVLIWYYEMEHLKEMYYYK